MRLTLSHPLHVLLLVLMLGLGGRAAAEHQPLGFNTAGVVDWSTELSFVDVMKYARAWISHSQSGYQWDTGQPIHTDARGWVTHLEPGQACGTLTMIGLGDNYPAGEYTLSFEGEGELEMNWDGGYVTFTEGGTYPVTVTPHEGLHIVIRATNPLNYIRNIQLMMPGFAGRDPRDPFHPNLIEQWRPFDVVRFMDWRATNNSPVVSWADRTTPRHATQTLNGAGVAAEYCAAFANAIDADAWINIPHQADDDYVTRLAQLYLDQLDPEATLYLEYSNEVWNGIFDQHVYAADLGVDMGLSDDPWWASQLYLIVRSREIFTLWEQVWGAEMDRVVRVLATPVWAWIPDYLEYENAHEEFDAVAIAPYFGGWVGWTDDIPWLESLTPAELIAVLHADLPNTLAEIDGARAHLDAYPDLDLLCYEAGQHLAPSWELQQNPTVVDLFMETNRHPGMYDLYARYLDHWRSLNTGIMMMYTQTSGYSQYGCFGLREYWNQPLGETPKYRACLDYLRGGAVEGTWHVTPDPGSPDPAGGVRLTTHPNPFNDAATITVTLPDAGATWVTVIDMLGREVTRLAAGEALPAGRHTFSLDGRTLASGTYLVRAVQPGHGERVQRITLVK